MTRRAAYIVIALLGCSRTDSMTPVMHDPGPRTPDDPVAAVVEGEVITLSRVVRLSTLTGRPPREVLDGMVDMTLLAHEAERRGLLASRQTRRAYKKALVQKLLAEKVEAPVDPDSVTMDEVKRFYVENYRNKGVLLEDAWRDIWTHLVAQRRRALYDDLIGRLRARTPVEIEQHTVEVHLGASAG